MQPAMAEPTEIDQFHSLLRKEALQIIGNTNTNNSRAGTCFISEEILQTGVSSYGKSQKALTSIRAKYYETVRFPGRITPRSWKRVSKNAQSMIDSLLYAETVCQHDSIGELYIRSVCG